MQVSDLDRLWRLVDEQTKESLHGQHLAVADVGEERQVDLPEQRREAIEQGVAFFGQLDVHGTPIAGRHAPAFRVPR